MDLQEQARALLKEWRGDRFVFGCGVLNQVGTLVKGYGSKALVVVSSRHQALREAVGKSLEEAGVSFVEAPAAKPNDPKEDVYRIATYILRYQPEVIVAVGGGSTIDCCKAADAVGVLGGEVERFFGSNLVSKELEEKGKRLIPLVAVQTSASSGSHLTKYSNVTDIASGQKFLIVDMAVVPSAALFDYTVSSSMPESVTIDGIFDAYSHTFESFCGAKPQVYDKLRQVALTAIGLCLEYAPRLMKDLGDQEAREAIGLATDLGGYAIMLGGTSGAHLNSFSFVRLTGHGTACGIMNPYYAVCYSRAIQPQLKDLAGLYGAYGWVSEADQKREGRALALAVARGMIAFMKSLGAPTTLGELKGFDQSFIDQALQAAKNPALEMKLKNMPTPMTGDDVDVYMRPVLEAARDGNLDLVKER